MRLISCRDGKLLTLDAALSAAAAAGPFITGLAALDALPPGGGFARGAVHELLSDPSHGRPSFFALLLAAAAAASREAVIWCDPEGVLYPPALAARGVPLERLLLLRPQRPEQQNWAVAECLRCKGVAAVVAAVGRLSRVESRRLQLAAERGGGVGLLLRSASDIGTPHAAATRWLVRPAPGERAVQRWSVRLIHGHGGRVGDTVILENCREDHRVRVFEELADRPAPPQTRAARAS